MKQVIVLIFVLRGNSRREWILWTKSSTNGLALISYKMYIIMFRIILIILVQALSSLGSKGSTSVKNLIFLKSKLFKE